MAGKKIEIVNPAERFISKEIIDKVDNETVQKAEKQKKKRYSLVLKESIHDQAEERAEEMGISFSALVSTLLTEYLNR